jgi:hypothetical protein
MVKRPGRIPKWGTTGKPANRADQMHHLQDGESPDQQQGGA